MKQISLFICAICILSLNAQNHRTEVPSLAQYSESVDIELNINRLLNEVISLDFSQIKVRNFVFRTFIMC